MRLFTAPVRSALLFSLFVLLALATLQVGHQAQSQRIREAPPPAEITHLPEGETLELLSLGYNTFVADILWMLALQYFDKHARRLHNPRFLTHYIDAILHLDPDFKKVYEWAGVSVLFASGEVRRDNLEAANHYLERGMEHYPKEAYYPYTIGLNYAYYYAPRSPEERAEMRKRALYFLEKAMQLDDVNPRINLVIANLLSFEDDASSMFDFLEQAYLTEPDPQIRANIARRLESLDDSERKARIERQHVLRQTWRLDNFPYASPTLFFHLGSRFSFNPAQALEQPIPEPPSP